MINRNNMNAWSQSDFYRNSYHRLLNWLMVDIVIIICLMAVVVYLVLMQKDPPYYASMLSGQIVQLTPQG